jgi:hypothetical protein
MDRATWHQVRHAVTSASRAVPRRGRRTLYSDDLIVKLYLWTVWHDRPLCWAFDPLHFNSLFRPRRRPGYSQFCKRLKTPRVVDMIEHVNARLAHADAAPAPAPAEGYFDGHALAVSENSRDPDARTGRGNGRFSKGYKLHAWATPAQRVRAHATTPLNAGETTVAGERLAHRLPPHDLTIADGNYDSDKLHRAMHAAGHRLLTPLKGCAKGRRRVAGMSRARLDAVAWWQNDPDACRRCLRRRGTVERTFANLSNYGGGLTHLPPWVRHLDRVSLYVTAKLALYHARKNARALAKAEPS